MVATAYRAQWSAPLYGDPAQNASNTWYFLGAVGSSQQEDVDEIIQRLTTFYQGIDDLFFSVVYMSNESTVTIYDMADAPPRVPIAGPDTIDLSMSANTALPADCSVCLSYHAQYSSGVNRARRRGRVFIGPLNANVGAVVSGQGVRVTTASVTALLDAAEDLYTTAVTPITWAMWSETDGVAHPITDFSVDNGLDTRRSRDNAATTRTARTVP